LRLYTEHVEQQGGIDRPIDFLASLRRVSHFLPW
jgi:hypothetical protein